MNRKGPLNGVKVLSVENYLAGNYGTFLMTMLGAEVVKVEIPGVGDVLRTNAPYVEGEGGKRSHGELRLMANKKSLELDLKQEKGRELFFRLVKASDVVWTNSKPESLERLGITYPVLQEYNPHIIYTTLSGFGHWDLLPYGPESDTMAFDIIAQGMAGLQFRPDSDRDRPIYNGLALGDQVTSVFAVVGTITALYSRAVTGEGKRVDVAMFDSMLALNEKTLALYSVTGEIQPRGVSATSAPYGAYRAGDGYVNIAIGGNPVWKRFCEVIGRPELYDDPRFVEGFDRVHNEKELTAIVEAWTGARSSEEVITSLKARRVPCAPLRDVDELVVDPHVLTRNMVLTMNDPVAGPQKIAGNPVKMSGLDDGPPDPPHPLGADTVEVLSGWIAMPPEEMAALSEVGVIGRITTTESGRNQSIEEA